MSEGEGPSSPGAPGARLQEHSGVEGARLEAVPALSLPVLRSLPASGQAQDEHHPDLGAGRRGREGGGHLPALQGGEGAPGLSDQVPLPDTDSSISPASPFT